MRRRTLQGWDGVFVMVACLYFVATAVYLRWASDHRMVVT